MEVCGRAQNQPQERLAAQCSRRLPPQSGKRHDGSDGLRPRIAHLIALDVLAGVFIRHSIAIFQVGGCAARRKKAGQQKSRTYQEEVLCLGKIRYHPCSLFCDMMAYQMAEKLGPGATAPARFVATHYLNSNTSFGANIMTKSHCETTGTIVSAGISPSAEASGERNTHETGLDVSQRYHCSVADSCDYGSTG